MGPGRCSAPTPCSRAGGRSWRGTSGSVGRRRGTYTADTRTRSCRRPARARTSRTLPRPACHRTSTSTLSKKRMCSEAVVKVDRSIRWHYTTTLLRLRIGARLTRYRNCKFHNFARTISRQADGISRYSVPPSAGPLLPLLRSISKQSREEKEGNKISMLYENLSLIHI